MDTPVVRRIFEQLARRPCSTCARRVHQPVRNIRSRSQWSAPVHKTTTTTTTWRPRSDTFPNDRLAEYKRYPMVTAAQLRDRAERPKRVKMLVRDFIEDSLYNNSYGYFSKQAVIFTPGEPFDFNALPSEDAFHDELGRRYTAFEDALDRDRYDDSRQLWHTPTELFRPHYGHAIARYMVENYKLASYPYHDLLIYEMGAGRGTLMLNVLDYIRQADPDVYARTKFHVIEVSTALASLQAQQLTKSADSRGHADKVTIVNKSIFDWHTYVPSPCFFLALEVFDNFSHDLIRYEHATERALQGVVLIDQAGDFYEFDTPQIDPVAARYLSIRAAACGSRAAYAHPLGSSSPSARFVRSVTNSLPFAHDLTAPEYIPTRLMAFFDVLRDYFPAHRLVTSDFHALPQAIRGHNAPVVQTRYKRRMVPVSTALVHQGYFDILFPTDFGVVEPVYRAMTGKLTRTLTHEDFFQRWAYVEDTQTMSGENPLLSWYKNASVMVTV